MEENKSIEKFIVLNDVYRSDLNIYNEKFNDNHLLVYVYMQRFNNYRGEINFCLGWLYEDLQIVKSDLKFDIKQSFIDLIDFGLIELVGDIDIDTVNKNTRLQVKLLKNSDKKNFTMILDSEIDKIFNLDIEIRKKKSALLVYCIVASRINNKTKYCYPSYENFKRDMNTTSDNYISDTLKLLKDNNLIDYANVGSVATYGNVEQGNNVYVLCVEKDYKSILDGAIADRKQSYIERGISVNDSKNGNKKRSLKQKINHRQKLFDNNQLDEKGIRELLLFEKRYFELIKDNEDDLREMVKSKGFYLFDFGVSGNIKTVVDEVIDHETGEILDADTEDYWGEDNSIQ